MKMEIKYAPQSLADVIYPSIGVQRAVLGYGCGGLSGHVMLYGPNGTGKTTVANLLPHAIAGESAIIDTNYEEVLSQNDIKGYLQRSCQLGSLNGSGKYFLVFHEFDNAKVKLEKLWTAMDDCGDQLMVIITTNNPMQVHQSIRSRCDEINMPALTAQSVLSRAQLVLDAEGLVLPDAQLLHYLKTEEHRGDLRKYMGILDKLLYLQQANLPMPAWMPAPPDVPVKPKLSVVKTKKQ